MTIPEFMAALLRSGLFYPHIDIGIDGAPMQGAIAIHVRAYTRTDCDEMLERCGFHSVDGWNEWLPLALGKAHAEITKAFIDAGGGI